MKSQIHNEAEFTKIYWEFATQIFRYIYIRVNRNKAIAQDITQEVFTKAWMNIDKLDKSKPIKPWIYTIARNTVIDHYRKEKVFLDIDVECINMGEEDSSAENGLMVSEVFSKLNNLPELDRELLTLRYTEGLELDEIAIVVGKPYKNVKMAVHRALQKLKVIVNK